ncbi:unnamed protein product [Acanthoscelides obtectus]|uniref:Glucose-methanol-choline oxidoreductase N-terminal domain-containing protein n=1 Tax=Acanthoscelides obtectus TaxID=200917 RepID=A0A9P0MJ92_ACAOB|nr:unnamed protein product [Acanthoscelides obtectus]CAK1645608.1 Glucose dehydrogenase [FAD, quinone] [Acanthoscelides obtectus]
MLVHNLAVEVCILLAVLGTDAVVDEAGPLGRLLTAALNTAGIFTRFFPRYLDQQHSKDSNEFDFIIVGSGPSGAALANRLSEQNGWQILLLEAGDEASKIVEWPFLCGALEFTKYNWGYKAEKMEGFCRGCIDGRMEWPHGKALGGSTIINYMIYVRGNRLDYDRWEAMGNPGWSYNDIFPYFLKSEDANISQTVEDAGFHRKGGYLGVSDIPFRSEAVDAYVEAAKEAGYPFVDYNGRRQIGVSYVQSNTKNGRRVSSESAFLRPIRNRKNFTVRTGSHVTRVLIEPRSKKAYGVEYVRNGRKYKAIAKKEVIISAGSLNSPQILMLSGIGPKQHLQQVGIPVIKDLPVGRKMYDHATFVGLTFTANQSIVHDLAYYLSNPATYAEYLKRGTGPIAQIGGVEALTYIKTNVSDDPNPTMPDIELIFIGGALSSDAGIIYRRMFNIPRRTYDKLWKPLEGKPAFQVYPMLFHPKSIGYIKLRSKNPFDPPKFYPNYFSDPENHDIKTMIAAIREIQRIMQSPAMQMYGAKIMDTPIPGCEQHTFNSDDYWECSLRSLIGSLYHQVSTCKMGPPEDKEAVVDSRLRVYGIKSLRVIDTSVIPLPVTAHTAEPAYVVGEKGADLIKQDWGVL